jgi:hypothetical protein
MYDLLIVLKILCPYFHICIPSKSRRHIWPIYTKVHFILYTINKHFQSMKRRVLLLKKHANSSVFNFLI